MSEPEREDPRYDEWPIKDHDRTEMNYLGMISHNIPYFHHDETDTVYRGNVDGVKQQIRLTEDTEHDIANGLGETIESIGERTGWESLSEFAQEHLTDEEND
jgi:hypothetical protein